MFKERKVDRQRLEGVYASISVDPPAPSVLIERVNGSCVVDSVNITLNEARDLSRQLKELGV